MRKRIFKKIKLSDLDLIVYDFDGVMTDNRVLVLDNGREAVFCNRSDGLAVGLIRKQGVRQIILSTEENSVVSARAKKLKLECIQGVADKKKALRNYCENKKYNFAKVLYIGNDLNDLEVMKGVGFPVAPSDACAEIKKIAKLILPQKGGKGVLRGLLKYVEVDL